MLKYIVFDLKILVQDNSPNPLDVNFRIRRIYFYIAFLIFDINISRLFIVQYIALFNSVWYIFCNSYYTLFSTE